MTAPACFAVGSLVCVKPGTTVPGFEDIPLGGWTGMVTEVDQRSNPPTYRIAWDQHTLEHMHPIFRKRSKRDGLEIESMWLGEADLLRHDGSPAVLEQPRAIRTRPLDRKDQDDCVRAVFGLTGDDPLPEVNEETLRCYHRYLTKHLSFPFAGTYTRETGFMQQRSEAITVVGLADAEEIDDLYGLFCEARRGRQRLDVLLGEIEGKRGDPNRRLVADYSYRFWNGR